MKISHLFFLLALLMVACKDDDDVIPSENLLNYDAANNSGPLLSAGEHELAVFFPASKMEAHTGKKLTEVQVYVGPQPPQTCLVKIYKQGTGSSPGTKLWEANVTSVLKLQTWNKFKVSPAIDLTGEGLWIGVFVEHAQEQQSIGCDAGPRKENGDWLFESSDTAWKTYQERTGESVNWNIRGVME
jgi:hypothetical protein